MTEQVKEIDVQKEEVDFKGTERTREGKVYLPRVDIYESDNDVVVLADMPGVSADSIDIMLEKNMLTINGYVKQEVAEGYSLAYAEYEMGDYQRSFTLSNEIDRENIEATVSHGVLRLHLPKAKTAQTRKIAVKTA